MRLLATSLGGEETKRLVPGFEVGLENRRRDPLEDDGGRQQVSIMRQVCLCPILARLWSVTPAFRACIPFHLRILDSCSRSRCYSGIIMPCPSLSCEGYPGMRGQEGMISQMHTLGPLFYSEVRDKPGSDCESC